MKINFLQGLIDKIRNKPNFVRTLFCKWIGIKNINDVNTLILGSSHLQNGFIAQKCEYNFALSSQDLYYGYNIYKILNNDKLKKIVVAFSVFTPGLSIIKTQCAQFCVPYKVLLNIDYQNSDDARDKNLFEIEKDIEKEIKSYQKSISLPDDYRGNILHYPHKKFNDEKAKTRALKHFKNNQRENSQMKYCIDLLNDTKKNNQNVYFVLPPVTKTYRNILPDKDIIFKSLTDIVKKYDNAKILNYYDTDLFDEKSDFSNEDHLSKNGAIKLSEFIRKDINE